MAEEGAVEFTMDEIAAQMATPPAPQKLEGDDIPEQFRGKTAAEVAKMAEAAEKALRISEQARLAAAESRPATVVAPPAPPAPPPPAEMTREEFQALYEQDPMAALEAYGAQRDAKLLQNLESRMGTLAAGAASSAEQHARAQYEAEFELFGNEIKELASRVPNKAFLATPDGWGELISYVRGRPGNFDKLVEHKIAKNAGAAARAAQANDVGFTSRSAVSTPIRGANDPVNHGLDATELKVAAEFGMSPAEYVKWRDMK